MNESVGHKTIVVTGGADGIGLNMVDNFLEHGAKLVIIIDINEELGVQAVETMTKKHGDDKAVFYKCDVTSELESTFEIMTGKYKDIDVLVNNAGVADEKSIRRTIDINVISVMEWSIKFYDYFRKDRGGSGGTIINIASLYALKVTPFLPNYHASKFAVLGFTKSLGHEYNFKKTGVRVIVVCPGYTYSKLTNNLKTRDDDVYQDLVKEAESEEWQETDAVGKAVIDIFEKAESATAWVVKGSRPAVKV